MLNYDQYHREPLLSSIRWTQEATIQKQNNNSRAVKNVNNHLEAGQAGASGRAPIRRQDPSPEYGFLPYPYNNVPNNEFNNYYNERAHLPEIGTREISPHYRQPPIHTFEYDDIANNRFLHTTKPVAYNIPHATNYSTAPPDRCIVTEQHHQQRSYKVNKDDGPFVFGVHSPSQFQLDQSRHDNTYDFANEEESDKSVIDNESNVLYCDKKINIKSNINADSGQSKQSMFRIKDNRKIKKEKKVRKDKEKKTECQRFDGKEKNKIKCVFVGDGAVGKTSLITTYAQNTFNDIYKPTAFDNYNVVVEVDRRPISVDICDTAGQDSLEGLRELCYPGTDVIILCFSVVKPSSFQSVIRRWAPCAAAIKAPLVLVGTQSDLRQHPSVLHDLKEKGEAPVSEAEAKSLASSLNAPYIETSAKMRSRLKDTFDSAILAALPVAKTKKSIWKKMFCFS